MHTQEQRNVLHCFGQVTVATSEIDFCLNIRQSHSVILFSILHIYIGNRHVGNRKSRLQMKLQ